MDFVTSRKAPLVTVSALAFVWLYRSGWLSSIKADQQTSAAACAEEEKNSDPGSKTVGDSSVSVMYRINSDMTDEYGRLYAGEMLRIIDIVAGVVSRRHADMGCVTISLDRFILVQEIRTGDLIHVDASVNRAWGSSLETGVRVTREDPKTGTTQYCCHAYLTFVAIIPSPTSSVGPSPSLRLGGRDNGAHSRPRPKLKRVIPTSLIEKKRFLLAGRRREARMAQPRQTSKLERFRAEVLALFNHSIGQREGSEKGDEYLNKQAKEIQSLEKELLADAVLSKDSTLVFQEDASGHVHVSIDPKSHEGVSPSKVPLAELEGILSNRARGRQATWADLGATEPRPKRSSTQSWVFEPEQRSPLQPLLLSPLMETRELSEAPRPVSIKDTFASTLHIVLPQHANSAGVLFGGQLMEWMEKTALIAAHRLGKVESAWVTAGMDGLEFREAVAVGHVLTFRAVVTRVWTSSVEVYVCSHADVVGSKPRFTNECFLTLVALSRRTHGTTNLNIEIQAEPGTAFECIRDTADERKAERLEVKDMLIRVYARA